LDWSLASSGLIAAILIVFDVAGPLRAVVVLAVWLIVPGWALVRHAGIRDSAARLVFTVAASAVIGVAASLPMVWTASWVPIPVAVAIVLAASASLVVWPVADRKAVSGIGLLVKWGFSRTSSEWLPWLILVVAAVLWAVSLTLTDSSRLGDWGLLPAFPALWYVGVGVTVLMCVLGVSRTKISARYMSASIGALVVMLYASANLVEAVPRLPWVYKHIAVTTYITATGTVNPSIDLYNRWPGFFSLSAFLGEAMGYLDPLAYAAWAEVGFALLDAVVVLAIARALTGRNGAVSWTATLVFTLCNWVGQNYYSPQAFAFTLYLTMCLVAISFLRGEPVAWVKRVEGALARRQRVPDRGKESRTDAPRTASTSAQSRRTPTGAIWSASSLLVLQAVVVVSHQLTPYIAVLALLPLCLVGYVRPRWLGPSLLVIAVLYLLPNLNFVVSNFGLFTGFNPFRNATYTPPLVYRSDAAQLQAYCVILLSLLAVVIGLAGFARNMLRGNVRTTLIVAWLAAAPPLILFAQAYGGEARFRVFLFALPWLSIGVAWLFEGRKKEKRRPALSIVMLAMVALFVVGYFQPEADNRVQKSDVIAAQWLDARLKPGDLIMGETMQFPVLIGRNYPLIVVHGIDTATSMSDIQQYLKRPVTVQDIMNAIYGTAAAGPTYLGFSDSQEQFAKRHSLFPKGLLDKVEQEVAGNSQFEKVYDSGAVRIYKLP